ncbi:Protein Tob2 [Trichoplax sp. H2]|nr:Protein Tob2 [Trichoplax sp. H2]|eukprot:RDD41248.1 Protein Tob2 [Trichoplax sp. H2]
MNEPPPKMDSLIRIGIDFLLSYIKDESLPQSGLDQFASELELAVTAKFDGHWYPQQPSKGSAYRCIVINGKLHPLLEQAAKKVGVSSQIIAKHFPNKLYLWIDPNEVSYRINDQRAIKTLYSAPNTNGMQYTYNQSNDYKMMEQQLKNGLTVNDSFTPAQGSGDSPKGFYTRNSLWIPTTGTTSMGFSQSYTMASGQPQYFDSGLSRTELSDSFNMEPMQGSPMHHNHYQQYQQHHQQSNNNVDYSQSGTNRNNSQMNHFPQYEVVVN